jgi:putative transposase
MRKVAGIGGGVKRKARVLEPVKVMSREEYGRLPLDVRVELIQAMIPLGLMYVREELEREVKELAGERYRREGGEADLVRHGTNPGSVRLMGQRVGIRVPRVRNRALNQEVPLRSLEAVRGDGEVNERVLRGVLHGLSCRRYEEAAGAIPGAIGLSASTVSREFIQASAERLRQFQERPLQRYDLVVIFLDGKTFGQDTLVMGLGVTAQGEKVMLGFVQTGTENERSLGEFLRTLLKRGLSVEGGVLVVVDGGTGLRAAVEKVLGSRARVQRCQWHKRQNVLSHLPKSEHPRWRGRLQEAYEQPTYEGAKTALLKVQQELAQRNLSAARSLEEGLEETLTLHRLGVFELLGVSLKTTNCIESVMSQVEQICAKVDCWRNSMQKHRWLAAALLAIEPRLNKIKGSVHLSSLRSALQKELGLPLQAQVA